MKMLDINWKGLNFHDNIDNVTGYIWFSLVAAYSSFLLFGILSPTELILNYFVWEDGNSLALWKRLGANRVNDIDDAVR